MTLNDPLRAPMGSYDPIDVLKCLEAQALASFDRFFDDQIDWIDAHLADVRQQHAHRLRGESAAQVARLIQTPSRQKAAHARRSPDKPAIAALRYRDLQTGSPPRQQGVKSGGQRPSREDDRLSPRPGNTAYSAARDVFGSPVSALPPGLGRLRSPPPRATSPPIRTLLSPANIVKAANLPPPQPSSSPVRSPGHAEDRDNDETNDVEAAGESSQGKLVLSPRIADLAAHGDGNLSIISEGTEPDDNGLRQSRMLSHSMTEALALPSFPSFGSLGHLPLLTSPLKESTVMAPGSSPIVEARAPEVEARAGGPKNVHQRQHDAAETPKRKSDVGQVEMSVPQTSAKNASPEAAAPSPKRTSIASTPAAQASSATALYYIEAQIRAQAVGRPADSRKVSVPDNNTPSRLPQPVSSKSRNEGQRPLSPRPDLIRPLSPRPLSPRPGSPGSAFSRQATSPSRIARAVEVPLRDSAATTTAFSRSLHKTPTSSLFSATQDASTAARRTSGGLPLPPSPTSSFLNSYSARPSTFQFGALQNRDRDAAVRTSYVPKAGRTSFLATVTAAAAAAAATPAESVLPGGPTQKRVSLKRKSSAEPGEQAPTKVQKPSSPASGKPSNKVEALKNRLEMLNKSQAAARQSVQASSAPMAAAEANVERTSSPPRPPRSPARPIMSPKATPADKNKPASSSPLKPSADVSDDLAVLAELVSNTQEVRSLPAPSRTPRTSPEKEAEYEMLPFSDAPSMPGSFAETMDIDEPKAPATPTPISTAAVAAAQTPISTAAVAAAQMESTTPLLSPPKSGLAFSLAHTLRDPMPAEQDTEADMGDDTVPDIQQDLMAISEDMAKAEESSRQIAVFFDTQETPHLPAPTDEYATASVSEPSVLPETLSNHITLAEAIPTSTSLVSSVVGGISSIFSKSVGASSKPKPEIKSLLAAREAREKERLETERKAREKEERRRQAEDNRKQRETMGDVERKRKEREAPVASSSQLSKSKLSMRAKPGLEEEPAKKRKVESESLNPKKAGEVRKIPDTTGTVSRPVSALGQSSITHLKGSSKPSAPAPDPVSTAPSKPKLPTSVSATGSALIGHKFMPDPSTLRTAANTTPAAATVKPAPAVVKPVPVKAIAPAKSIAGPSRISSKPVPMQSRVSSKILQQAAAEAGEQIDLPDIDSEYSDPEDVAGHAKRDAERVQWAQSPQMRAALKMQESYNPDELFGHVEATVDLETIFTGTATRPSRVRPRSSSAVWDKDRLTKEERDGYNRLRYG